ncbi:hypothetical protein PV326_007850 [Microctonus aethiopoides]|nr:hypothetical protein PV326_007850 [Microctonus aethiopoides]
MKEKEEDDNGGSEMKSVSPLNAIVVRTGVRGWLDGSHDATNWLKYIRSTSIPHEVNMRHVLVGGQVVYETVRYIGEGEELLMGPREPLQLQDMLGENTTDDRTDRETGHQKCEYVYAHIG